MNDLSPYLEQIRERVKITEVVGQDIRIIRKGREFMALCPFHKEKTPSFTLNDEKGFYHCFGCGAHGDIISYTMQRYSMDFIDAVKTLADKAGISLPQQNEPQESNHKAYYFILEEACVWFQENLKKNIGETCRSYLAKRQFSANAIDEFRLGFAPDTGASLYRMLVEKGFPKQEILNSGLVIKPDNGKEPYDRFRGRLMFPIMDHKGKVVAFGGRLLGEGQPKYLNSSDTEFFHKGQLLYGYHLAQKNVKKEQPFIVVEGYCDVIALYQAGFKTAVAPLGTAVTSEQLQILWRRSPQPLFCFDGDEAGLRAAYRAAHRALPFLASDKSLSFCYLPKGEDPDSLIRETGKNAFIRLLQAPVSLVETLWQSLLNSQSPSIARTPEEKAALKKEADKAIELIKDADIRYFYKTDFNQRFKELWFQERTKKFKERKEEFLPVSRPLRQGNEKKNLLSQKILLATLINHPTLLSEVAEQLALLEFSKPSFQNLKEWLLERADNDNHLIKEELLRNNFKEVLAEILTPEAFLYAPFAGEKAELKAAHEGWKEVWERTVWHHQLKQDFKDLATDMKGSFDQRTWERLKILKKSLTN